DFLQRRHSGAPCLTGFAPLRVDLILLFVRERHAPTRIDRWRRRSGLGARGPFEPSGRPEATSKVGYQSERGLLAPPGTGGPSKNACQLRNSPRYREMRL